eukprot:TRINITY_DN22789_c0_g1_i1.p1 TRINITY_DN22789_c0_g1~~TRINITY_DN22789_c0_g1_i1.p1  ORF type:complete len:106 (+),score=20.59 TRINITY_DN22789_c0_g1_i1:198-515(+)
MLTEAQFNRVITVTASFEDERGFAESVTSAATTPVARVNAQGDVVISGTPTVGNTLSADITDMDGVSGEVTYQWFADDEEIVGATQSEYIVEAALIGQAVSVQVT